MKLKIEGVPTQDGVNVELIEKAATYMMRLLMAEDPMRYESITVEICCCDDLVSTYGRSAESNYTDDRLRPSEFYIDIDSHLNHRAFLISLAHELVHIKQMAFGHRQESLDGKGMRWMGLLIYPNDMDYYDLPWEIEAHGREYGLYDRFVNYEQGIVGLKAAMIVGSGAHLRVVG